MELKQGKSDVGFTPVLHQANSRHKKTNRKWLVFLNKNGRHDRI
ncbi:hypothetical protein HMPREF3203_01363 [Proteus mirabilis]|nr:hypothetical protein HMPREF3203_01363 [Proteus mirabilis]